MDAADKAIVYFNPHTIEHKKLPPITESQVQQSFAKDDIEVYTDSKKLLNDLLQSEWNNMNLLLMSSGNFDGIDFSDLARKIVTK